MQVPPQHTPAIVVSAWNRPMELSRLLNSLLKGNYSGHQPVLHICIDGNGPIAIKEIAENFDWPFGEKVVERQEKHLGLRNHILHCGRLTKRYGAIIMLEDDLVVSPAFYLYASAALNFYDSDPNIAGISIYNYQVAESCFYPFYALDDGTDSWFLQFAVSWGQAWSAKQWTAFEEWLAMPENGTKRLPKFVSDWPASSWKKDFIRYLIDQNRFFAMPQASFSTNFHDSGTHADTPGLYQVPLQMEGEKWDFCRFEDSRALYDAFFEPLPKTLNAWTDEFQDKDYAVDFYGIKDLEFLQAAWVLTSRKMTKLGRTGGPLSGYSMEMKPAVMNVIQGQPGNAIHLVERSCLTEGNLSAEDYFRQVRGSVYYAMREKMESIFPSLSIVIPKSGNAEALNQTLDSIAAAGHTHCEIIVVSGRNKAESFGRHSLEPQFLNHDGGYLSQLAAGFAICKGSILCWIEAGMEFVPGSLGHIVEAFGRHGNVDWLCTIPPKGSNSGKDFSIPQMRWSPVKMWKEKPESLRKKQLPGCVFMRSQLMRKAPNKFLQTLNKSEVHLWREWIRHSSLYLFAIPSLTQLSSPTTISEIPVPDFDAVPADLPKMGVLKSIILGMSSYFYAKDVIYLRTIYRELYDLPDLIRLDEHHGNSYFSRH